MKLQKFEKEKFTITEKGKVFKLDTQKLFDHTIIKDKFYSSDEIETYYSFRKGWMKYDDMDYYGVCNKKLYYINVKSKTKNERTTQLENWVEEIRKENNQYILMMKEKNKIKKLTKIGNREDLPF